MKRSAWACALAAVAAAFPQPLMPCRTLLALRNGGARVQCCADARSGPLFALSGSRTARVHMGMRIGGGSRVRVVQVLLSGMATLIVVVWCPATGAEENTAARTTRVGPKSALIAPFGFLATL